MTYGREKVTTRSYAAAVMDDGTCVITDYWGTAQELTVPFKINDMKVVGIGYEAFTEYNRDHTLTEVVIPEGITIIDECAFYYCSNLRSVTIPDGVTTIGKDAFASTALTSVVIPDSVTGIGRTAFCDTPLRSVTIPESVTYIGYNAFADCSEIRGVPGSAAERHANECGIPFVSTQTTNAVNTAGNVQKSSAAAHAALRGYDPASQTYQYVHFGTFDQNWGEEPILWRVLAVQDGRALLLSEYILAAMEYGPSNTWKGSYMEYWLNHQFLESAFTQSEKNAIPQFGNIGKVFLISEAELKNAGYGFSTNASAKDPRRQAEGTLHAFNQNLFMNDENGFSGYYTRTPSGSKYVSAIDSKGAIMDVKFTRTDLGIRPALWIDLSKYILSSGSGTISDPFR